MPHVNGDSVSGRSGSVGGGGGSSSSSGGGDDLASSDEIKVFKEEGEVEEEKRSSSETLIEEKSSLVIESEEDKSTQIPGQSFSAKHVVTAVRPQPTTIIGKPLETISHHHHDRPFNMGYTCIVTPYPYPNGTATPIQVSMVSPHFGSSRGLSQADLLARARDEVAAAASLCSGPCCTPDFAAACTGNKMGMVGSPHPGSPLPFMMYNGEHFAQPPPAHMGIPPVHIDPKTGMPRPSMYPIAAPGQYHHPAAVFAPDFAQMQWHSQGMYAITTAAGFRSPYPTAIPVSSASMPRFAPGGLLGPHPGLGPPPSSLHHHHHHHPSIITSGPKQEISAVSIAQENHHLRHSGMLEHNHKHLTTTTPSSASSDSKGNSDHSDHHHHHGGGGGGGGGGGCVDLKKLPHVKKPLNAFMLYMKEMRAKVVAECTLKESAAINQILGRRWHALGREEQAKYYDLARKERQLHMQLYPGWSARDNYAQQVKKKAKKKCKSSDGDYGADFYSGLHHTPESNNPKKCRARFGLDQQSSWCKPCRRKKKCIRYVEGGDGGATTESEDNVTSAGSVGEAPTPKSLADSDLDHMNNSSEISLSSPPVSSDLERPIPCHSSSSSSGSHQNTTTNNNNSNHHHHSSSSSSSSHHQSHSQQHHHHSGSSSSSHHSHSHHHLTHHHHPHPHHHPHHHQTHSYSPHDSNHPLSISQLTGQCSPPVSIKREALGMSPSGTCSESSLNSAPSIVSVT